MWEDVLKNQITIPKQNVKTRRSPLPEKEDPDCYKIIDDIFQAWADCNKVQRPNVKHARDSDWLSLFSNSEWCVVVRDMNNNFIDKSNSLYANDPDIFSVRYNVVLYDPEEDRGDNIGVFDGIEIFLSWNISKRFNKWRVWQYGEIDFGGYSSHMVGTVMINWEVEPNVFTEGYIEKLFETSKNCLNFGDKLKQMKPSNTKVKYTSGDLTQVQRILYDMAGDGDISKNQITVPKQSVKTKRTPLPEKDDERCYPKIHKIVEEFFGREFKDKYRVNVISAESKKDNQFWCEQINYEHILGLMRNRILTPGNSVPFE